MYVDFSIPQDHAAHLKIGAAVTILSDAIGTSRHMGQITSVNPNVEIESRSIRARATLRNADSAMRPGMFVQVVIDIGDVVPVTMVPGTALRRSAYASSVFVIAPGCDALRHDQGIAEERLVRLGPAQDDNVVVLSGLRAVEIIAVAGVFKLHDGAAVRIDNSVLPPGLTHSREPGLTP